MNTTLLDEHKVAELLTVTVGKLRQDRFHRRGLSFIKVGRLVRYTAADVEKYLQEQRVECSPHPGGVQ